VHAAQALLQLLRAAHTNPCSMKPRSTPRVELSAQTPVFPYKSEGLPAARPKIPGSRRLAFHTDCKALFWLPGAPDELWAAVSDAAR
jgi:energy-converting hydrogenase Eha subunit F